jgi:monoamine oxidase
MSMLAYAAMVKGGGGKDFYAKSETKRAPGGNDALATALAGAIAPRVLFNAAVLSITRAKKKVLVAAGRGEPTEFDAVVVTAPPSVWRRIAFDTPLGQHRPQMGENVKLACRIDRPVWEDQGLHPELKTDGMVQQTWVSAISPTTAGQYGFTLFSGGRSAQRLRGIDPRDRAPQAFASLRAPFPRLQGAASEVRFIDWPGMANAMASYSFPAPGEVLRFGPTLVDGWNDGLAPVRFAGEYTSYAFIGYMEGALQSGVRVGNALLAPRPAQRQPAKGR